MTFFQRELVLFKNKAVLDDKLYQAQLAPLNTLLGDTTFDHAENSTYSELQMIVNALYQW